MKIETKAKPKGGCFVHKCKSANCRSTFQDEKYGQEMRVYNVIKSNDAAPHGRCTVCLSTN